MDLFPLTRVRKPDFGKLYQEDFLMDAKPTPDQMESKVRALKGDVDSLIIPKSQLTKNRQLYDSFKLNTKEAIYALEYEKPLSLKMTEEEQMRHIFKHCIIVECNENLAKIVGYAHPENVLGTKLSKFFRNSEPQNVEAVRKVVRSGYQPTEFESKEYGKDGKVLYLLNWVSVVIEGDVVVRMWARLQDITKRKKAELELKEALAEVKKLKDQLEAENVYLKEEIKSIQQFDKIIGECDELKYVFLKVEQVASTESTVLILGETGTGKELVAHKIYELSGRKDRPLVKVNCAALPANLIESELFGHEKGAFSGADKLRIGRFELADGGTLFLDEIGELTLELQPKLLRVLQSGEFERIGSSHTQKVDVRVIAATNRKLEENIQKGSFREDLYFRISVYPITIPPLRQRMDDIPLLVNAFVSRFAQKMGKSISRISASTMEKLVNYTWPGNVRELENVIERAVITSRGPSLQLVDKLKASDTKDIDVSEDLTLEAAERNHITRVLKKCKWKVEGENGASAILGLHPSTLRNRMRRLNLSRPI
jgi:PAS domain S-box-containing protein